MDRARDAVVAVHNHPANRRGWPATAAEASLRAARASAALDGAPIEAGRRACTDPVLAGAVRAAEESGRLLATWRSAPLQVLARLHVLAAAGLVPVAEHGTELGRPRPDRAVSQRLGLLADLVTGGTAVPAPVLVAVVHGELLALAPFTIANGVVARAAARLTAVASRPGPEGPRGAGGGAPAACRASTGARPRVSPRVAPTRSRRGCGTAARSGRPGRRRACRSPTPRA